MLRITGAKVYDPANNLNGVVKDICIDNGRIVESVSGGRTIDGTGMVVFPGGVDIHTHVAGAALNFARAMTPENQRKAAHFLHTPERRMGLGGPTPTTFATFISTFWKSANSIMAPPRGRRTGYRSGGREATRRGPRGGRRWSSSGAWGSVG